MPDPFHTPDPDDTVVLSFACKARYALAVQSHTFDYIAVLERADTTGDVYVPPFDRYHGPKNAWHLPPWTDPADEPAARWIVSKLKVEQRHVIAELLAAGDDGVTTQVLLANAGYPAGTSPRGVFRGIGGRFRRCDRRPAWDGHEKTAAGKRLTITGVHATLFGRVIRADYPELAAEVGL
jgi:hypothetical protein